MKRMILYIAASVAGVAGLFWALPVVDDAQPHGIDVSRAEARAIADEAAREMGIPVDDSWPVQYWARSQFLDRVLGDHDLRQEAELDPGVRPRLGGYITQYFRIGREKNPSFGYVIVGRDGAVQEIRRIERAETAGESPTEEALREDAARRVASLPIPRADRLEFLSAHPTVHRSRVDHRLRFADPVSFPLDDVAWFVDLHYLGGEFAGWTLAEEYADGTAFEGNIGGELVSTFAKYVALGTLFVLLVVLFLRKYHAGEVGVRTGGYLFVLFLTLSIAASVLSAAENSVFTTFGTLDAPRTALATGAFSFLFVQLPIAILLFVGWAVGESYARERWGHRLASFDSILHRDPVNSTVGKALLYGLAAAPVVAAAALVPAAGAVRLDLAAPDLGSGTVAIVATTGGAATLLAHSVAYSILTGVVAIMLLLSLLRRWRWRWPAVGVASLTGVMIGAVTVPVGPELARVSLGLGAVMVACVVFYTVDLLASVTALAFGSMLSGALPYLHVADGAAANGTLATIAIPALLASALGVAGITTRREIRYQYEDLAPHVRRIVERERVKAEIDAANRIQAALLPGGEPEIAGVSVASHYRAATEIGGDYFDFLNMKDGEVGVAFGDVAGHGLTSGIVMAMAKSALLVQLEYDSSPRRVMEVMNDVVIRTGPSRMMMTFFFGLLDPVRRRLRFSSAGHLDPYVFRAETGRLEELSAWGYPLGVRRRNGFPEIEVEFSPGDRLILYSDGLIEALNDEDEPFGFARFEKVLLEASRGTSDDIRRALLEAVRRFTRNRPPEDDQTLVVISFDPEPEARQLAS